MKIIESYIGTRLASGYHTGSALVEGRNGKLYVSTESGTRPATKKEIERYLKSK